MARIRSVKPEFWHDRKLARLLTRDERMLYVGLWNHADEHGRANGDARVILGQVFPFEDDLTVVSIETMLDSLERAGVIHRYVVDSDPFLFVPRLSVHQRLEPHKSKSKFPPPPADSPYSENSAAIGSDSAQISADLSAHDPRKKSLLYGTGSMEHGEGVRGADALAPAPSPKCSKHINDPHPPDCGRCKEARLARAEWDEAQGRSTVDHAKARRASIATCMHCDDAGWILGSEPVVRCSHQQRRTS